MPPKSLRDTLILWGVSLENFNCLSHDWDWPGLWVPSGRSAPRLEWCLHGNWSHLTLFAVLIPTSLTPSTRCLGPMSLRSWDHPGFWTRIQRQEGGMVRRLFLRASMVFLAQDHMRFWMILTYVGWVQGFGCRQFSSSPWPRAAYRGPCVSSCLTVFQLWCHLWSTGGL